MKLNRIQNAKRNIVYGVSEKLLNMLLQFGVRSIFLYTLGVEYLGLSSLFASILSVLSLAELGFGSAIGFSMYQAIADDDTDTICALMHFYKRCYQIIGCIIFIAGLLAIPFIPLLIKDSLPGGLNLYVLYGINLFGTCITYFLFGYKGMLLGAFQRTDINHRIGMWINMVKNALEIGLLLMFKNYYLYALIVPFMNITTNIVTGTVVDRMYPQYCAKGILPAELKVSIGKKVNALLYYKLGSVVFSNADSIVISAFLGLTILGQFQNYFFIINTLAGFLLLLYGSFSAGVGNVMALEGPEKTYQLFKTILYLQSALIAWCAACLLCLYQPFIQLWAGEENVLPFSFVIILVVFFYEWKIQDIAYTFKEAAGMWEADKFRPFISAGINLITNIILVQIIGLNGVLLSTIIVGICIDMTWCSRILFRDFFHRSIKEYFKSIIQYALIAIFTCILTYVLCTMIQGSAWEVLFFRCVLCVTVAPLIIFCLFRFLPEYQDAKLFVIRILRKSLNT